MEDKMQDIELLQYIHKTAQMGIDGLRDIEPKAREAKLRSAITGQIGEYERIAGEAGRLLKSRGEEPRDPGMMAQLSSGMSTKAQLVLDSSSSKLAEMVIQGNTMGVTKGTKHLNDYAGDDRRIKALAEQLIATEHANIEQMKPFL